MASLNKVFLMGNITRDPELRYIPSGMAVSDVGLAVTTRLGKDKEETVFVECTCWGRTAEVVNEYCKKGSPILVEGRLRLETWEDKTTGGKRSRISVVVDRLQLLSKKSDSVSTNGTTAPENTGGGLEQIPEVTAEDIPF